MSHSRIAVRYAKSLLGLAVDHQKLDEVKTDFDLIYKALEHRDLANLFRSPIIPANKKLAVVNGIFSGKIGDLSMKYMHLLINKGRESYLKEIAEEYQMMHLKHKQISDITVISAAPMSESVLADLKARLLKSVSTEDKIQITNVVDPSILGGFILQYDDKRYDASILSKMEQLKSEFSKNLYIKEF
jgi:F-type H+-transporting ATPase subunit delta